jgi:hypothetical protein
MKVELSRRYVENLNTQKWFSLVLSEKVTTDTLRGLDALDVYKKVFDLVPTVWLEDDKLIEVAKARKYLLADSPDGAVIVYHGHTNIRGGKYFNITYGIYHELPQLNSIMIGKKCVIISHAAGNLQICSGFYTLLTRGSYLLTFSDHSTYVIEVEKLLEFGITAHFGFTVLCNRTTYKSPTGIFATGIVTKIQDYVTGDFDNITTRMMQVRAKQVHDEVTYSPHYLTKKHVLHVTNVRLKTYVNTALRRNKWFKYELVSNLPLTASNYTLIGYIHKGELNKQYEDESLSNIRRFKLLASAPEESMIKLLFRVRVPGFEAIYSTLCISYRAKLREQMTDRVFANHELAEVKTGELYQYM